MGSTGPRGCRVRQAREGKRSRAAHYDCGRPAGSTTLVPGRSGATKRSASGEAVLARAWMEPDLAERAGFDQARMAKLLNGLHLHAKSTCYKDLDLLDSVLSSHGFLLSCDPF